MKQTRIHNFLALALAAAVPAVRSEVIITTEFAPGLNIPDVGTIVDIGSLQLELGSVTDVTMGLNIGTRGAGGFNGELIARLSRDGREVVLLNQAGRSQGDLSTLFGYSDSGGFDVTFRDGAANDIHTYQNQVTPAASLPLTGEWQPDGRLSSDAETSTPRSAMLLSVFNGLGATGNWALEVEDTGFGNTLHRLDQWSLSIRGSTGSGTTRLTANSSVTATGAGETFYNATTISGSTRFYGTAPINFDGTVTLASTPTIKVENIIRFRADLGEDSSPRGFVKTGGGTLRIDGTASHTGATEVREGSLIVDGQIVSSHLQISRGALLGGSGSIATLELGGTISPGNGVGIIGSESQTWNSGSSILFEIQDAGGAEGAGWDLISIDGELVLAASPANPITILLTSLTLGGDRGWAEDFDPSVQQSWQFARATQGITGFDEFAFIVNADSFDNDFGSGQFSVTQDDQHLNLTFTPVPEPAATAAAAALVLAGFAAARKWKRKLAQI